MKRAQLNLKGSLNIKPNVTTSAIITPSFSNPLLLVTYNGASSDGDADPPQGFNLPSMTTYAGYMFFLKNRTSAAIWKQRRPIGEATVDYSGSQNPVSIRQIIPHYCYLMYAISGHWIVIG